MSDGIAEDRETITITVDEVNLNPVLDPIGSKSIEEETLLTFTATASDDDIPVQTLSFTLDDGTSGEVPIGASITIDGVFTWTPTEDQGPNTYTFDVVVSDDIAEDRETITITVSESNVPPVITLPSLPSNIYELILWSFTATATDHDIPVQALTFSLEDGVSGSVPAGASIDGVTGVFSWTPTEVQGPGDYMFDVVVTDGIEMDSETVVVTVDEVNLDPVLDSIGDQAVIEETLLTFTATASDGDIPVQDLTFSLDGSIPSGASITSGGVFTWTPTEDQGPDSYTFDVVVMDEDLAEDRETIEVTVSETNIAPVLDPIGPHSGDELTEITFTATASDVDVPVQTLTFSLDGTVPDGASITSDGVFTWTPTEDQGPNTYTFDVVVTDGIETDSETITITVDEVNDPPVISDIPDQTIAEGSIFAAISLDDYVFDVEDPDEDIVWTNSGEVELIVDITDRVATITVPHVDWNGQETITFRATDTSMLWDEDSATFTVTAENDPPVANNDLYETDEDTPLNVVAPGVLDNDSDIDGPSTLTVVILGGVSNGSLDLHSNGSFNYVPDDDWNGIDSYTYRAYDGIEYSNTATVFIYVNVKNDPPNMPSKPSGSTSLSTGESASYSTSTTDPDSGDQIRYRLDWGDGTTSTWTEFVNSSQSAYKSKSWSSTGTYNVKAQAEDAHGDKSNWSNALQVTVTSSGGGGGGEENQRPVANDDSVSTNENTAVWIDVLDNDKDANGDETLNPSTVAVTNGPSHGSTNVNTTTGEIRYTPDSDYYGSDSFKYTVRDNAGATSNKATVAITVVGGVKADASAGSPYYGFVGEEITFNGSLSYDPDAEGYIVTWYWDFGDGTNGTGETTTHTYSNAGTYDATLTVTDNDGDNDTDTFNVTIAKANNPPSKPTIDGPITGNKNTTYEFTTFSSDLDNDTIKYYVDWGDGTVNESSFLQNGTAFEIAHSWASYGEYLISVKAYDNQTESETNESTILIDVLAIDDEIKGYLVDEDSDDIYDFFNNTDTGEHTDVEQENSTYLIDGDGNGKWDHTYSQEKGVLTYYEYVYQKYYRKYKSTTPGFEIISLLSMIAIALIIMRRRRTMGV